MPNCVISLSKVAATVEAVLPAVGLAYLVGDDHRDWTVTRSTPGTGLASLEAGQRVRLTVEQHASFAVVHDYAAEPHST